jgi:hypothetical protein
MVEFICPIGAGMTGWAAAVHAALTLIVVTVGSVFLTAGTLAYRRQRPAVLAASLDSEAR